MNASLTAQQAAAEIIALINSRPRTPSMEEIAAIIERAEPDGSAERVRGRARQPDLGGRRGGGVAASPLGAAGRGMVGRGLPEEGVMDGQLEHWARTVSEYLDKAGYRARQGLTDEEHDKIHDGLHAATKAIWARPCTTWSDVVLRAAVAVHWNSSEDSDSLAYPDLVIAEDPDNDFDARSLAHLVRGILDIAGFAFDNEGRLLAR